MPIRLGQLEIHAELNEICGPAGRRRLEPQAMAVLELFVAEPGRAWPRDELLDRAWPGRVVSDATLTGVISRLRRTLADAGITDVRIETRSKRGYMLILSETLSARASSRRRWLLGTAGLASILLLGALAAGVAPGLLPQERSSLDGVRLDFDITFPDDSTSKPALWLENGKAGEIRLDGVYPLAIRVVPEIVEGGLLRLRVEAASISHWAGFEQVIGLETESRFVLMSGKPDAPYDIRFVASLDDHPKPPQETPR